MCRKLVSYTCRKLASYKSAGKFPTKCDYGLNFSRIFCFTCNVQETSFLQKCRKFSYKMFSWYKFWTLLSLFWNFPTKCRKISYRWILVQENFLHTSVKCCTSAGKFPAHTVKIWIFLSSAGNMIPALQPPNTGALSHGLSFLISFGTCFYWNCVN